MGRGYPLDCLAILSFKNARNVANRQYSEANIHAHPGDRTHHLLTKRRGSNHKLDLIVGLTSPPNRSQSTSTRLLDSLVAKHIKLAATERTKIVGSQQKLPCGLHLINVQG
jgi:hypothetical protein